MARFFLILLIFIFISCSDKVPNGKSVNRLPVVFPDYTEVTIPNNIAPLNFKLKTLSKEAYAEFTVGMQKLLIKAKKGQFTISPSRWNKLLKAGNTIIITVYAKEDEWIKYASFNIYVSQDSIDPYLVYRLIEPGYALWNQMGIYQRNIESYSESAIMENKMSGKNCMNCHSFCMQNPDKMLFHMRGTHVGTLLMNEGNIEKLNTKTDSTMSVLVYPSWHPSGRYVTFSVNQIKQSYHMNDDNRVEVYDEASDVVIYDVINHEVFTMEKLSSGEVFETFPSFSPDGKMLYFCSAKAYPMPHSFEEVKYSLCAVSFDPETRGFGSSVDTLYHAPSCGKSVSFPRVSPDGKYLLYTLSGYGNFSIWHKDADLCMVNLATGKNYPLDILNSNDVESYHSWSSNSRWIVFSSRRIDGLYTRPYIAHVDIEGQASKPFLLPQKDTEFYHRSMKSYNIPEFITGKVKSKSWKLGVKAKKDPGIDVKFSGK